MLTSELHGAIQYNTIQTLRNYTILYETIQTHAVSDQRSEQGVIHVVCLSSCQHRSQHSTGGRWRRYIAVVKLRRRGQVSVDRGWRYVVIVGRWDKRWYCVIGRRYDVIQGRWNDVRCCNRITGFPRLNNRLKNNVDEKKKKKSNSWMPFYYGIWNPNGNDIRAKADVQARLAFSLLLVLVSVQPRCYLKGVILQYAYRYGLF